MGVTVSRMFKGDPQGTPSSPHWPMRCYKNPRFAKRWIGNCYSHYVRASPPNAPQSTKMHI
jgi:hypothetical protein